jgi:hypothetical protein
MLGHVLRLLIIFEFYLMQIIYSAMAKRTVATPYVNVTYVYTNLY